MVGNETVLDALEHAGGSLPTAEPKDIQLTRAARRGKPSRVYHVDLEAIQDRGDTKSNYQMFPGDRLVAGRNAVVKKTVEIDRLSAPIEAISGSMQQHASLLPSLQSATAADRDEVLKDYTDLWTKQLNRSGRV